MNSCSPLAWRTLVGALIRNGALRRPGWFEGCHGNLGMCLHFTFFLSNSALLSISCLRCNLALVSLSSFSPVHDKEVAYDIAYIAFIVECHFGDCIIGNFCSSFHLSSSVFAECCSRVLKTDHHHPTFCFISTFKLAVCRHDWTCSL